MGDILKSSPSVTNAPMGGVMDAAQLGMTTLVDNHGNKIYRNELTCNGKKAVDLDFNQMLEIFRPLKISSYFDTETDGTVPLLFGLKSPFETMCRKLDSDAHHSGAPPLKGHVR